MNASNRRLYWVYRAMLKRCGLINGASKRHIERYEMRGIKVCDEWANSWHAFRDWAWENGYGYGLQIDRINNDGPYSPENCRWVSGTRNMRNTSQTFPVVARRLIDGIEIRFDSEADAAEFLSIPKSSIRDCVNGKQTQTHGFEWSKDDRRAERTCRMEAFLLGEFFTDRKHVTDTELSDEEIDKVFLELRDDTVIRCSACHFSVLYGADVTYTQTDDGAWSADAVRSRINYCPHCGARVVSER